MLGGLIDEDVQEDLQKVPLLGSIPLIGKLFQSTSKSKVKKKFNGFYSSKNTC